MKRGGYTTYGGREPENNYSISANEILELYRLTSLICPNENADGAARRGGCRPVEVVADGAARPGGFRTGEVGAARRARPEALGPVAVVAAGGPGP